MARIVLAAAAAAVAMPAPASAHYYDGCRKAPCKRHVVAPYRTAFLAPVGACESGGSRLLRRGLRAVSTGGTYRGRYQFDAASWRGAGGRGDPVEATWLEQAYRAVVWLHRAGIKAWPLCGRRAG